MDNDFMNKLVKALPRGLLLDLYHMTTVRALKAYEIIRDQTDLKGKRARGAEGQIRFRTMEQGFQTINEQHGGVVLEDGVIEGTDLRFYQPFARYAGGNQPGVVLCLASMPQRGELPVKNQSRLAGVSMNFRLTPRLALTEGDPQQGDIFVSFMVARDPARAGQIDEVAIGIISSDYKDFVFYEKIEKFMARYAPADQPTQDNAPAPAQELVKLKRNRKAFMPPEVKDDEKNSRNEEE